MHVGTYTTILHVLSAVSVSLALIGIYCVLRVRVKAMSPTYRRLLFMYLVLSLLAELSHTIFFTPVILAPLMAGYNEGILSFLPPILQYTLWLGFSVGSAMVMELQFHFRFNTLLSTYNPLYLSMNSLRKLHFFFIFYVLFTAIQVYFSFSDSPVIRFELSKKYPALRTELLLPQTIAISPEFSRYASFFYYYSTTSIALHGAIIISMITYCYMRLASGTSTLSTATKKTAKYYLKSLILQFSVHSIALYGPFVLMFYIQYMFQILNRDITNVGMVCVSLHGSCSILTMLIMITQYRDRILRVLTCKGPPPERQFSFDSHVCLESTLSNMFYWLCGLVKKERKNRETLSDLEIRAVKDSWNRAKKRGQLGQNIFKSLIELKPSIKTYFNITVEDGDSASLVKCKEFQAHAARMENFLDLSVGALGCGSISSVGNMAHRVGSVHFYRGVNFGADNWLAFKKAIIECILHSTSRVNLGTMRREESFLMLQINGIFLTPSVAAVAWEKFMGYVIREMKKGFLDEACRNCREDSREFI